MKASRKKVKVKAPSGYHWMLERGRYYLMPHKGKFVPHENASLKAEFKVKTAH
jgi:hypothetical protein